ncbi:MAG: energy-coupling factor transporter transmembrane protein EcfT [Coriobacteriaceae bacterium]|nr:energy-coupling factor transporter transmembrane protein EcfT [Coriobacteriaceae bacterium]MDD7584834.1 energy-coupling factor transporter transmembrane component T [Coriobacteriaceae bacterium]
MYGVMDDEVSSGMARWLRALNPGVKLLVALLLGIAALVFPSPVLAGILVLALFVVAVCAGAFADFAKVMLGFGVPATIILVFIQGFYGTGNETFIVDFGFAWLGLEGVLAAFKTVGTVLVFLGGFFLMNRTATPSELVADLTERGLTPEAGYLVLASLNVVPQMRRRMAAIQEAQAARGLEFDGGMMSRLRATLPLLSPVVMSSLTDAQERSMTLETHGFNLNEVRHTSYYLVRHSRSDVPLTTAAVALVILSVLALVLSALGIVSL